MESYQMKTYQTGQHHLTTRRIVFTALMAALTAVGSGLRITMPLSIAGTTSFHLGNIMCVLSGLLLGPSLGGLAAGLGSALYDMTNPLYISECWITFLTKGMYGLVAGLLITGGTPGKNHIRALIASVTSAAAYALVYLAKAYFYNGLLLQGMTPEGALAMTLEKIPATVFNAAVAVIFAPILAAAIWKALEKSHLTLE